MRSQAGITQAELGKRVGTHKSFVSQVERAASNVSIDTLDRFMSALRGAPTHGSLRMKVGLRLREARERQRISQEALGERAGFSVVFVGRVERGEVSTSLDHLELLARTLNIDPWTLFDEEDSNCS